MKVFRANFPPVEFSGKLCVFTRQMGEMTLNPNYSPTNVRNGGATIPLNRNLVLNPDPGRFPWVPRFVRDSTEFAGRNRLSGGHRVKCPSIYYLRRIPADSHADSQCPQPPAAARGSFGSFIDLRRQRPSPSQWAHPRTRPGTVHSATELSPTSQPVYNVSHCSDGQKAPIELDESALSRHPAAAGRFRKLSEKPSELWTDDVTQPDRRPVQREDRRGWPGNVVFRGVLRKQRCLLDG